MPRETSEVDRASRQRGKDRMNWALREVESRHRKRSQEKMKKSREKDAVSSEKSLEKRVLK